MGRAGNAARFQCVATATPSVQNALERSCGTPQRARRTNRCFLDAYSVPSDLACAICRRIERTRRRVLAGEVETQKQFYTEELALIRDHPDLAMVTDGRPDARVGLDIFVSEPRVWETDRIFIEKHGPGLQYLCLQVPNLAAAHRDLLRKGVECTLAPVVTEYFDVATFKDPAGVDLLVSATRWSKWGDGYRDEREAPRSMTGTV